MQGCGRGDFLHDHEPLGAKVLVHIGNDNVGECVLEVFADLDRVDTFCGGCG